MHEKPSTETRGAVDARSRRSAQVLLRRPRVRLGAAIAIAVLGALIAWLVIDTGDGSSPSTPGGSFRPVSVSPAELKSRADLFGRPIYWTGPQAGYTYELTRTQDGKIYVRYLPSGVAVGDKRAFTVIATYPFKKAFAALRRVAKGKELAIKGGGIALVHEGYPESVHVAYPGVDYQIEVYDPSPAAARSLAVSGLIQPAG